MSMAHAHYDVVVRGSLTDVARRVHSEVTKPCWRLWTDWHQVMRHPRQSVFIVGNLEDLVHEKAQAKELSATDKRFLLIWDQQSPPESFGEAVLGLGVRSADRLHVARLQTDTPQEFMQRFANLICTCRNHDGAILDAWVEPGALAVISPTFERLRVRRELLPKQLATLPDPSLNDFTIDPDGHFLHWPHLDVHMGWAQLQQTVDPTALLRAQQKSRAFNQQYGQAIESLRLEHKLSQGKIAGLDARTIRRIEHGEVPASTKSLIKLAAAHKMAVEEYLSILAKR